MSSGITSGEFLPLREVAFFGLQTVAACGRLVSALRSPARISLLARLRLCNVRSVRAGLQCVGLPAVFPVVHAWRSLVLAECACKPFKRVLARCCVIWLGGYGFGCFVRFYGCCGKDLRHLKRAFCLILAWFSDWQLMSKGVIHDEPALLCWRVQSEPFACFVGFFAEVFWIVHVAEVCPA